MTTQKKTAPKAIAPKAADDRAARLAAAAQWFYTLKMQLDELYLSAERVDNELKDPASPLHEFLDATMVNDLVGALDDATNAFCALRPPARFKLPDPTAV